ncbi:MAG: response regulator [Candidatus Omnitrophica bacterium]|nr:response regulator [Candidatus Omnitrophota bacterium]
MFKKILLIDDDPGVHFIATPILSKLGYDVISARHGEQGLQLALNQRPDLIILDVIMPGIKGRELCIKMKAYQVLKSIPVVFLTAKDSEDDVQAELDAGAVTHLTKPIDAAQLVTVVKGILES